MKYILALLSIITIVSCNKRQPLPTYNDHIPTHDSIDIASSVIGEVRRVNVWTPPSYQSGTDSFPVLYMPDGGIKEDFPHIANTLDTLIKEGKIPEIILVGIENTERRRDLTGPTSSDYDREYITNPGGANNFRSFIIDELRPHIDSTYRTTPLRSIIGESLSGLFIVETLMLAPNSFDHYIAIDPSLWYNDQYLTSNFDSLTANFDYSGKTLWYASSDAEDIYLHTNSLDQHLTTGSKGLRHRYVHKPHEQHHTIFRASKAEALTWTFGNQTK